MKRKHVLNNIIVIVFLILVCLYLFIANIKRPRVLIVHSYDKGYSWVSDMDKGIKKYFDNYYYLKRWYYMDTKRHPHKDFLKKAGYNARLVISQWHPDILILVDDNAQSEVGVYYINHPTINIIYAGVNSKLSKYGYNSAKNVKGILERIPFYAFKEILIDIFSENARVVHVSDSSITSYGVHEELDHVDWSPLKFVKTSMVDTYKEWKERILEANKFADILLITHYHTIGKYKKNSSIVPAKQVLKWTLENATVPSIGGWGFFVEDGGMLSIAVSPFEQGEFVAKATIQLLEKEVTMKNLRSETNRFYLLYINKKEFERYKIALPSIYESFARATGTYFE